MTEFKAGGGIPSLKVNWSDRLEELADKMFDEWTHRPFGDPFARTCVIVNEPATREWLRDLFLLRDHSLLDRAPDGRRVLGNLEFRPMPEFVNDWLAAMTGKDDVRNRDPAAHPYSRGVLAWRIDAILRERGKDSAFRPLADYVGTGPTAGFRRFDLASRIARLFDDYLGSRHPMLAAWENRSTLLPSRDPERWQCVLYRLLAEEEPDTYASEYIRALAPNADPAAAFEHGFPRYAAVHVFDAADIPWPWMAMLDRISTVMPVTVWTFNPSYAWWIENPTKRQASLERAALALGKEPDGAEEQFGEPAPGMADTESPEERKRRQTDEKLLAALASGTRGLLAHELDATEGDCRWLGNRSPTFQTLREVAKEVHVCHSPRRELEAARDALHRFFAENRDARPGDALVLCADWERYSPLVEAVFGNRKNEPFPPIAAWGAIQQSTPVLRSFADLLDFRTNRFEVTKVFALLGVPEIRTKLGLGADGLETLRNMVRTNNIHWGRDAADVRRVLGDAAEDVADGFAADDSDCPFTWRRGLDRFMLDALLGPDLAQTGTVPAGALGELLPQGSVEGDRAKAVVRLARFVERLADLRTFLREAHKPETWRTRLLQAIDDFYDDTGNVGAIVSLRKAVDAVADAAAHGRADEPVPGEVFCAAVLAAVQEGSHRLSSAGDAVRFAPLTPGAAVPARFVWICGLNDGTFPRNGVRPSFDLVGRRPTMYDVSDRETDGLALLKAALGARDRLCLSYVGRDIRTNRELPAAVPLIDLLEWFAASALPFRRYDHPLQSFSPRYFLPPERPGEALPPSYSAVDRAAAASLAARADGGEDPAVFEAVPFPPAESGATTIDLDDLAAFCSRPNWFLTKNRLRIPAGDNARYDLLEDDDELGAELPRDLGNRVLVRGADAVPDVAAKARELAESGISLPEDELRAAIEDRIQSTESYRKRQITYKKDESDGFQCVGETAAEALARWEDSAAVDPFRVDLKVDGRDVVVNGVRRTIDLDVSPNGKMAHAFVFSPSRGDQPYRSDKVAAWVRHLAGHAAGAAFVTAILCANDKPVRTYRPLPQEEAKRLLERIVAQAMKRTKVDIRATSGDADASPEMDAAIGGLEDRIVSTRASSGQKRKN
jgi:exodeoxyribonuclease V gamma subunit